MRAIIIDDKDALALMDQLRLEAVEGRIGERLVESHPGLTASARKAMVDEMHRRFHYIVVRWLQDQGASCVR